MKPYERTLVRIGTLAIVAVAVLVPFWMATPEKLPGVALGSEALLHVERTLAMLVALLFLLVVAVRGWRGQLPKALSGRGIEYEEVVRTTADAARAMEDTAKATVEALDALQTTLEAHAAHLEALESRLSRLETGLRGLLPKG